MNEAPISPTDIDAAIAAKLAYHAFSASVIAYEMGNPQMAALSREVVFETLDLLIERESTFDHGVPENAFPTG